MEVIMKKYTIVAIFMLMGFSAQGMQKMARCTQAGLRASQVVQQTRSKVSLAALAQVHKEMPRASFNYSPLLGAASALNRTLSRELKESKLAQSFFNQLPEEPVCYTVLPFKPAVSLTPKLLGELVALHTSGNLYKPEFFESATFKEWHAVHNGSRDKKDFKYQVKKQLLSLMQHESDQKKVYEMLLAAVYFKADTADDLKVFLKASEVVMATSDETLENKELMEQYADTFLTLTAAKKDVSFLQAEEIREMAGYCSEKALWSVLNLIFYNPEKETLDLTMVPVEVQKSCLPEFATFIATYSNPKVPKFYQSAYKDFLKLVHGIKDVRYLSGEVEIPGERSETLKILNYLFGTKTTTYQELAKSILSSEQRMITFCEPADKDYGPMKIEVDDTQNDMVFSGTWSFSEGHVGFVFDKEFQRDRLTLLKKAHQLEMVVGSDGYLVRLVPGWLHQVIRWRDDSKEGITKLFQKNKVTKAELNELSPGLQEKKCTLLHTAIEQKRPDLVSFLLEQGVDSNKPDSNGDSPLRLAMRRSDKNVVRLLLAGGASVHEKGNSGDTALMYAATDGDKNVVELLLAAGASASVNEKDNSGNTALLYAARWGTKEIVELLLAGGASANEKDNSGITALMCAARGGTKEIVELVLAAGASASVNEKNNSGITALMYAARGGTKEIVELLLAAGASASVNEKNNSGDTALMCAARQGTKEIVELLLAAGASASVNEKDNSGDTALMYAARDGTKEIVELLLAAGASASVNEKDKLGRTALLYAARQGNKEIVELLLAAGASASVNEKDNSGDTALMYGARQGNKEIVELLLAAGAVEDSALLMSSIIKRFKNGGNNE
jgi:ankyrin repeat protein